MVVNGGVLFMIGGFWWGCEKIGGCIGLMYVVCNGMVGVCIWYLVFVFECGVC